MFPSAADLIIEALISLFRGQKNIYYVIYLLLLEHIINLSL